MCEFMKILKCDVIHNPYLKYYWFNLGPLFK